MNVPETFFSVSTELKLFFMSCLLGAVPGVLFDIFRTLRMVFRHSAFVVFAEDVVFCILWGLSLTAFSSVFALGILRGFIVLGSILGFILYIFTVGQIVSGTVRKLLPVFYRIFSGVLSPFRFGYALIRKKAPVKFVGCSKIFAFHIKKVKLLLQKTHNLLYNKTENKKRKNVKNVAEKKNIR